MRGAGTSEIKAIKSWPPARLPAIRSARVGITGEECTAVCLRPGPPIKALTARNSGATDQADRRVPHISLLRCGIDRHRSARGAITDSNLRAHRRAKEPHIDPSFHPFSHTKFLSRKILYLSDSKGENTSLSFNQPAILIRVDFGGCAAYCMALQVDI